MPKGQQGQQPQPDQVTPERQGAANLTAAAAGQAPPESGEQAPEVAKLAAAVAKAEQDREALLARLARLEERETQARAEAAGKEIARRDEARQQAVETLASTRPDTTTPGGKYLVGGVLVDCDNKPLAE